MQSASELIDAFCDQVWLQDGLAPSSLASYRRDLRQWADWLDRRGQLASHRAAHRRRGVSRRPVPGEGEGHVDRATAVVAAALLRAAVAAGHAPRGSHAARAGAETAAATAQEPERGEGRSAAGGARHEDHARPARPRDAGDALCDGPARVRARRADAGAGLPRHGRRSRARQGQQGTARPAGRGVDRVAQALSRRSAPARSAATASRRRCSSPRAAGR